MKRWQVHWCPPPKATASRRNPSSESFRELAYQLTDVLTLSGREVTFIGGDRISTDQFRRVNQIATGDLHGVTMTSDTDVLIRGNSRRW